MQPKLLFLTADRNNPLCAAEKMSDPPSYHITYVSSGSEAIDKLLSGEAFDLILVDMPGRDGYESVLMIGEQDLSVPILFLTEEGQEISREAPFPTIDYIQKPLSPVLLQTKVRVLANLSRRERMLKRREKELSDLEKRTEDLQRLSLMISHDLQSPLRRIRMYCSRLLSRLPGDTDGEEWSHLNRIQGIAQRMQGMTGDLLRQSADQEGKRAAFENVDLNEVLRDVLSDMADPIREKNAEIILDTLPALPANAGLLSPLFSNLIANSLKYSKKQVNPVVRIYSEAAIEGAFFSSSGMMDMTRGSDYCRIFIEDNGIGFEQQYAEQIFDMFRRLHPTAEYEGSGIGLALCKKIVELHSGFISAKGVPGKGALFIISLPTGERKLPANHHG